MQSQQQAIKIVNYVIHFPSGYKFVLRIPQQITVKQITQIMRSYQVLHNTHGLKSEGKLLRPLFLSTLDKNIAEDIYMADSSTQQLQLSYLKSTEFKIQYGKEELKKKLISPIHNYQLIGKFANKYQKSSKQYLYVAKNVKNCTGYLIHKFDKTKLTFSNLENLITMRDYYIHSNNNNFTCFTDIKDTFQTQNWICLVTTLYPFQLSKAKIENRLLMDSILSQIARIIHVLQREQIQIQSIAIDDFWMDFKFQVRYCGMNGFFSKKKSKADILQSKPNINHNNEIKLGENKYTFNQKLMQLMEGYFKNCNVKVIESYIPLFHWLKNNRIINYMDFLKYFSLPQIISQPGESKLILKALLKNYTFPLLQELKLEQKEEFINEYIPRTHLFTRLEQKQPSLKYVSCNLTNQKSGSQNKNILEEVIENISTIKKKKKQSIVCAKPVFLGRKFMKAQRIKTKSKNKSYCQGQNLNKSNKTSKCGKHHRRISQFLIDD